MSSDIPEAIRTFIRRNINSISMLDVLFLLKRDEQKSWTPEEVSLEMRTNPSYALAQMKELAQLKLLSSENNIFRFHPSESELETIEELERLYNSRRSTIINYIYSQPIDSIRDFADAFRIKKD